LSARGLWSLRVHSHELTFHVTHIANQSETFCVFYYTELNIFIVIRNTRYVEDISPCERSLINKFDYYLHYTRLYIQYMLNWRLSHTKWYKLYKQRPLIQLSSYILWLDTATEICHYLKLSMYVINCKV